MRSFLNRLLCVSLVLCCASLSNADDILKGRARWEWTLGNGKGKDHMGTFMGYQDGTIKHGKEQVLIGNWTPVGTDSINVKFLSGDLKGTVLLKRTNAKIITFEGKLNKAGKDEKLVVRMYKD